MDDTPTCGKGLAEHSALPAAVASLIGATAAVLENHINALVEGTDTTRQERTAYLSLIAAHRALEARLRALAEQMSGYRDLPPAPHDEQVMASPEALAVFRRFVEAEKSLHALLQAAVQRDEKMLEDMQA